MKANTSIIRLTLLPTLALGFAAAACGDPGHAQEKTTQDAIRPGVEGGGTKALTPEGDDWFTNLVDAHAKAAKPRGGGGGYFTYRGGPVLQHPRVFVIFLGPYWGNGNSDSSFITSFWNDMTGGSGTSTWYAHLDKTNSYSVSGSYTVGPATLGGTAFDPTDYGSTVTDAQLQATVSRNIASHSGWKVADGLYYVMTGLNVSVQGTSGSSCTQFCGYHNNYSDAANSGNANGDVYYSSIPYVTCAGCTQAPWTALDIVTTVSSHEFAEAISDPIPGQGWYNNRGGEIGDVCAWGTNIVTDNLNGHNHTVQKIWDNVSNACAN